MRGLGGAAAAATTTTTAIITIIVIVIVVVDRPTVQQRTKALVYVVRVFSACHRNPLPGSRARPASPPTLRYCRMRKK